jgi:hypothetical protein
LATRGESRLVQLRTQRDEASARLEFEAAAALHAQTARVESVRALAPELVRPLSRLRAVILQAAAEPGEVAVFLYENGSLTGPVGFSTVGMRIQNEQSGSTSLFAHPMTIEAIPEASGLEEAAGPAVAPELNSEGSRNPGEDSEKRSSGAEATADSADLMRGLLSPPPSVPGSSAICNTAGFEDLSSAADAPAKLARGALEARLEAVLAALAENFKAPSPTLRQGHLALVKRWYYRPEARREGEIFFPDAEGRWPMKALLRGVGRVFLNSFKPPAAGS